MSTTGTDAQAARSSVATAGGPEADVVIVSYNRRELLLQACDSALRSGPLVRLIVVDNASSDDSLDAARRAFPSAKVIANPRNVGFARAVNQGAAAGSAPAILLLNNDARLRAGALRRLLDVLQERLEVGAVGPRIVDPDDDVELSVGRTLSPLNEARFKLLEALYRGGRGPLTPWVTRVYGRSRDVKSLTAACTLLRRNAFEQLGGFDERFFLYAEDVDLCVRLRQKGWCLRYEHEAVVEHLRGASASLDPLAREVARRDSQLAFYRKHRGERAASALRLYLALRYALSACSPAAERRRLARRMLAWCRSGR